MVGDTGRERTSGRGSGGWHGPPRPRRIAAPLSSRVRSSRRFGRGICWIIGADGERIEGSCSHLQALPGSPCSRDRAAESRIVVTECANSLSLPPCFPFSLSLSLDCLFCNDEAGPGNTEGTICCCIHTVIANAASERTLFCSVFFPFLYVNAAEL